MNDIASWIWVLIPLAAIGIAPFKMWIKVKERQLDQQSTMTAEKARAICRAHRTPRSPRSRARADRD